MDSTKQRLAAEVLELGEMLFDTMIEAVAQQPAEGTGANPDLIEEMREAADEYFTAVRLLLRIEQQTILPDGIGML